MEEFRQTIDTFNRNARALDDYEQLGKLFSKTIKLAGYHGYDAWCLREGTVNNPRQAGNFFIHDYNLNVVIEYILSGWLQMDPVIKEVGQTSQPFDFVSFLRSSTQNSSVRWQLRMLKMFNIHHAWLIPLNTIDANRGVTCYLQGDSPRVKEHFLATRTFIHIISCEFMEHIVRLEKPAIISADENVAPVLSARELDCLHWAARGKTNAEIADILQISPNTVRYHMKNLFVKLKVRTRSNAVLLGIQTGLIEG